MNKNASNCSCARMKIRSSAEALFSQHGYELTSTRDIASASGMNISLINYYFGSKQALYREIFKAGLEDMAVGLQSIAHHPISATAKLYQFLTLHTDSFLINANFPRMLYRETLFLTSSCIRDIIGIHLREAIKICEQIMAEGISTGDFKPVNSFLFYMTLVAMLAIPIVHPGGEQGLQQDTFGMDEVKAYLNQILLINHNTKSSMN